MAIDSTTTCPDCGALNDSNDLFCKECGTSLAMVNTTDQHTAAFTPVSPAPETQTTSISPSTAASDPSPYSIYASEPQPPAWDYRSEPESSRGAVLGWLAATLMLVILAAFLWASVISDATRDRITGIF